MKKYNRDGNYVAASVFCNKAQEIITNGTFIRTRAINHQQNLQARSFRLQSGTTYITEI